MKHKCDVVITGAGFTGLMIARRLLDRHPKLSIVVVDKEPEAGRHASGRNSGVLHSGIYYPPDTLKSRFALAGNRWWKSFCIRYGLPLLETGKVIAATRPGELAVLDRLESYGRAAGLDPIRLEPDELSGYEPSARGVGGLFINETAVTQPKRVLETLQSELAAAGVIFVFGHTTGSVHGEPYAGRVRVNAAGAGALALAKTRGLGERYELLPFKGIYARLKEPQRFSIRGSIYPVPNLDFPFLGVHLTRTAGKTEEVYLGPTALPAFWPEDYRAGFGIGRLFTPGRASVSGWEKVLRLGRLTFRNRKFRRQVGSYVRAFAPSFGAGPKARLRYIWNGARRLVPDLQLDDIEPSDKCGIRPQLVDERTGELVMDFVVEADEDSVHILNAISPAYTSAPAFAEYLVDEYISPRLDL